MEQKIELDVWLNKLNKEKAIEITKYIMQNEEEYLHFGLESGYNACKIGDFVFLGGYSGYNEGVTNYELICLVYSSYYKALIAIGYDVNCEEIREIRQFRDAYKNEWYSLENSIFEEPETVYNYLELKKEIEENLQTGKAIGFFMNGLGTNFELEGLFVGLQDKDSIKIFVNDNKFILNLNYYIEEFSKKFPNEGVKGVFVTKDRAHIYTSRKEEEIKDTILQEKTPEFYLVKVKNI